LQYWVIMDDYTHVEKLKVRCIYLLLSVDYY
jgi:hypothetical protein